MAKNSLFPQISKSINDFLLEEEGSISRNKVLVVGSLMLVMSVIMAPTVYAKHSSHRSHSSQRSHSSGSGGYHSSHSSHSSSYHSSHSSHSSYAHNSHSSAAHSNTSNAVNTTATHNNTSTIATPTFAAPELYDLSAVNNKLLGTHAGTTASGNAVTIANLRVSDFND